MSRIRRRALAMPALVLAVSLAVAPSAAADPVGDAVSALRSASVYVDPEVAANGAKVDVAALSRVLPFDVKVAVLPDSAGRGITLANSIADGLGTKPGSPLTVGVLTVTPAGDATFRAASTNFCPGFADTQAAQADADHAKDVQNNIDLAAMIEDFLHRLSGGPIDRGHCPSIVGGSKPGNGSGTWWGWAAGAAVLVAASAGGVVFYRRARRAAAAEAVPPSDAAGFGGGMFADEDEDAGQDDGAELPGGSA